MSLKILLVEDDPEIGDYMQHEIRDLFVGARLDVFQAARLALSALDRCSYDIVISDMGLRDQWAGGKDVLEKANSQGAFSVLFSGLGHYPGLHLDYILKKPFSGNELQEMKCIFEDGKWTCKLTKEATAFIARLRKKYRIKLRGGHHEVSRNRVTDGVQ